MENKERILVIDDDETITAVFRAGLKQEGFNVDVAATGKEAIEKSRDQVYNLALIDIRLPDMEGTKLLTEMKETTPKMRKIIVTGYPDLQNAIASVQKGADFYITKPTKLDELVKVVKEQLQKQREEKEYGEKKVAEYIETRLRQSPL
ncbi:MAG TPA: response regulator [Nitrososphaerales archaeon]|nr:response regulator [Nitrososphaerales archaeon]